MSPPRPLFIRTLTIQHWYNTALRMLENNSVEEIACSEREWLFKVKRIDNFNFLAITYHKGEEVGKTTYDLELLYPE